MGYHKKREWSPASINWRGGEGVPAAKRKEEEEGGGADSNTSPHPCPTGGKNRKGSISTTQLLRGDAPYKLAHILKKGGVLICRGGRKQGKKAKDCADRESLTTRSRKTGRGKGTTIWPLKSGGGGEKLNLLLNPPWEAKKMKKRCRGGRKLQPSRWRKKRVGYSNM